MSLWIHCPFFSKISIIQIRTQNIIFLKQDERELGSFFFSCANIVLAVGEWRCDECVPQNKTTYIYFFFNSNNCYCYVVQTPLSPFVGPRSVPTSPIMIHTHYTCCATVNHRSWLVVSRYLLSADTTALRFDIVTNVKTDIVRSFREVFFSYFFFFISEFAFFALKY